MFIPKTMKTAIAKAFYDKEIHLMDTNVERDAEGGVKPLAVPLQQTFYGNVNFSNCQKIQEDYGLDYRVDITVTTDYTEIVENDIMLYDGERYEVRGIYNRDSHRLIAGTKWRA